MGKYLELKYAEGGWEYVSRVNCRGAVIILVYHQDRDEYLMVEQYRPPVQQRVLEFPAGLIDGNDTPMATALRELEEEAGITLTDEQLIPLGIVYSSVGMTDEKIWFYAVTITHSTPMRPLNLQGAESHHGLVTRWANENDILQSVAAKAISIYARFRAWQHNPNLIFPEH
ncbi:NUDIX hydrolase [Chrysiogenes arsenatis]|uniref:NUDIX hydrolase n=1 Tax=Chrysiogenes arsenatis TaxID=309797 RepID=UPI00041016EA|nr:NUDIX hydrolase [Chrysiogenes arsenatis]